MSKYYKNINRIVCLVVLFLVAMASGHVLTGSALASYFERGERLFSVEIHL